MTYLGRLTAAVENYRPGVQADTGTNIRTEYTYDANGNRLTIKDGNGHITNFTYDALGHEKSESDPLGHTWQYGYDKDGNRISQLDANGKTTTYTYDALKRQTLIDYPAPDADVTFSYDAAGRRVNMTDGLGTTTWEYDALDRPISITDPFGKTIGYSYDALGERATLTYPASENFPNGRVITYEYRFGRPARNRAGGPIVAGRLPISTRPAG